MSVGTYRDAAARYEDILQSLRHQRTVGDVERPVTADLVEGGLSGIGIVDVHRETDLTDSVFDLSSGVDVLVGDLVQALDVACLPDARESSGDKVSVFETGHVLLQEPTGRRHLPR